MRIDATPEARSMIREHGGLLFLHLTPVASIRGAMRRLVASFDPPPDALDYQRFETRGFLVFLPPGIRPPREVQVRVRGRVRRRVEAFWNGLAFVL